MLYFGRYTLQEIERARERNPQNLLHDTCQVSSASLEAPDRPWIRGDHDPSLAISIAVDLHGERFHRHCCQEWAAEETILFVGGNKALRIRPP